MSRAMILALNKLVEAAENFMSSDPDMPSHEATEKEMEEAIAFAKSILADKG